MKLSLIRTAAIMMPLFAGTAAMAQTATSAGAPMAPAASAPAMAPAAAPATGGAMAPAASMAKLSKQDHEFITKAAEGGAAEVAMAQLAQQKGSDASVKQFAQGMIDDHTPNNQKLATLASSKGVTPPTEPSASQQKMMTKLQGMDGAKFDHAYISGQVKAHQAMLKEFQRESTNGSDTDLKAFADATIPTIQKHITMAQNTK